MYPWKWFILGLAVLSMTYFVPSLESKEANVKGQELIADKGHHGGGHHGGGHHGGYYNRGYRHYDNWGSRYYLYDSTPRYYYRQYYYYPDGYYYSDPYYYYYPERRSGVYFRFGW